MKNWRDRPGLILSKAHSEFNVTMFGLLPQAAVIKERAKKIDMVQQHGCRVLEKYGERTFQAR